MTEQSQHTKAYVWSNRKTQENDSVILVIRFDDPKITVGWHWLGNKWSGICNQKFGSQARINKTSASLDTLMCFWTNYSAAVVNWDVRNKWERKNTLYWTKNSRPEEHCLFALSNSMKHRCRTHHSCRDKIQFQTIHRNTYEENMTSWLMEKYK